MQLVWGGLGLMACFAATVMDYRWFKKIAFPLFIFTLILLVLVLIPGIGLKLNGARRWFDLGPMNFQPSELAKISLLMALALWGERHVVRMREFKYGLVIPGAAIAVTLGLIFVGRTLAQPCYWRRCVASFCLWRERTGNISCRNARRSGGHCGGDYERSRAQ